MSATPTPAPEQVPEPASGLRVHTPTPVLPGHVTLAPGSPTPVGIGGRGG